LRLYAQRLPQNARDKQTLGRGRGSREKPSKKEANHSSISSVSILEQTEL